MSNTIWTKEAIAARRAGGDALVTADGWSTSTITGYGPSIHDVRLSCVKMEPCSYRVVEVDPRDGDTFPSTEDAEVYLLNAGRVRWYRDTESYRRSQAERAERAARGLTW